MIKSIMKIQMIVLAVIMCLAFPKAVNGASYLMISDLGTSAEVIRRGNIEGFSTGANSVFENPAGLYRVKRLSSSVFATQLMQEVTYRNVAVAFNSGLGVFALGYMDAGVDDIITTRKVGEGDNATIVADGVFSYKNRVIKFGYQNSLTESFHLGVNVSGYLNEIHTYLGMGYNMDAGLVYQFSGLEMSLFARNIIPLKVTYTDSEDPDYVGEEEMPLQVVFGASYGFGDIDIMGQIKFDGVNSLMSAGVEYQPQFLWNVLSISAGYKEYSVLDKISNTVTLGAGIHLFGVSLDYAYEQSDHFEYDTNSFASVGFNF